jgi:hypothetical protein
MPGRAKGAQRHYDTCQHCGVRRGEVRARQKQMADRRRPDYGTLKPIRCTRTDGYDNHYYITQEQRDRAETA